MQGEHKSQIQSGKRSEHEAAGSAVRSGFNGEADSGEADSTEVEPLEGGVPEDGATVRSADFDEDDLIRRTLRGDHDAFELLVRRFMLFCSHSHIFLLDHSSSGFLLESR